MTCSSSTSSSTLSFSPRVAGPAPPPSWTRQAIVRKAPAAQRLEPPINSLCSQCAQLATDIVVQNPRLISTLSIATKQHVLNRLGLRLTDRLLSYFQTDEHYSQLNLHSAPISFTWFVRCFWKIEPFLLSNNNKNDQDDDWVADDWEEEEEEEKDDEEEYYVRHIYDPSLDWALEPVIHLFNQPVDQEHILMTPLSVKLISLDLSFIPLPGYAISLIIATLPHLSDLSMAGCFTKDPGLVILARQMKQLKSLNIGYHGWLDLSTIEPIDWKRDLLKLQWLNVSMCGQDFRSGEVIAQHIMEHCSRRQLHIDFSSSSTA
ncbi:hypothetical protein BDC45DRAFT_505264 [Circinella umbellata]|nr:hypothetical protein BDC45DRAFT_505264 [Circinella umbellata]